MLLGSVPFKGILLTGHAHLGYKTGNPSPSCIKHHPAKIIIRSKQPKCLKTNKPHKLPLGHEIWKLQELTTLTATHDSMQLRLNFGTMQSDSAIPCSKAQASQSNM